jgi:hypothetical protein
MASTNRLHGRVQQVSPPPVVASFADGILNWDTGNFKQWHISPDHGCIWIKGVLGAGKSVLTARLAEQVRSQERYPFAILLFFFFFLFRYVLTENRRRKSLIRDWFARLLPHSLMLPAYFKACWYVSSTICLMSVFGNFSPFYSHSSRNLTVSLAL